MDRELTEEEKKRREENPPISVPTDKQNKEFERMKKLVKTTYYEDIPEAHELVTEREKLAQTTEIHFTGNCMGQPMAGIDRDDSPEFFKEFKKRYDDYLLDKLENLGVDVRAERNEN